MPDGSEAIGRLLRRLPHNIDAEMAVLGGLIANNRVWERVADFLRPEHFVVRDHQRVYQEIAAMLTAGRVADPVTLKSLFEQDEMLQQAGGVDYLLRLIDCAATPINASEYARYVSDLWRRRELIDIGEDIVNRAYASAIEETAEQQIELAERALLALRIARCEEQWTPIGEASGRALEAAEIAFKGGLGLVGSATGLVSLDNILGGLRPQGLYVVAGRPGMGKSGFGLTVALNLARAGHPVSAFSLEMSEQDIGLRALSSAAGIDGHLIQRGKLRADDFPNLIDGHHRLVPVPLLINDRTDLTIADIRRMARREVAHRKAALVVVDYLQLVGGGKTEAKRVYEVGEVSRGLKAMAKELNIPVIALAQLNRAVEARDDKRPLLSDLRDSGNIEQDADVVILLYREEYYLRAAEPKLSDADYAKWLDEMATARGVCDAIIAKNRFGPAGKVARLRFDEKTTTFTDLEARQ